MPALLRKGLVRGIIGAPYLAEIQFLCASSHLEHPGVAFPKVDRFELACPRVYGAKRCSQSAEMTEVDM